jgi:hypothetical protein
MKESVIQRACLDLLEALRLQGRPIVATRTNSGKIQTIEGRWVQLCREGWPDISAIIDGRFVGIETKRLTGRQGENQRKAQRFIEHAGGVYLLVNDLGVLRSFLRDD